MIKKIKAIVKNYMKTHCLFFWHDYTKSDDPVPNMMSSERWYWYIEICVKCSRRRAVMRI